LKLYDLSHPKHCNLSHTAIEAFNTTLSMHQQLILKFGVDYPAIDTAVLIVISKYQIPPQHNLRLFVYRITFISPLSVLHFYNLNKIMLYYSRNLYNYTSFGNFLQSFTDNFCYLQISNRPICKMHTTYSSCLYAHGIEADFKHAAIQGLSLRLIIFVVTTAPATMQKGLPPQSLSLQIVINEV